MVRAIVLPLTLGMPIDGWHFASGCIPDSQPQQHLREQSALSMINNCNKDRIAAHGQIVINVVMSAIHWFCPSGALPPFGAGGACALHLLRCSVQQNRKTLQCLRTFLHMSRLTSCLCSRPSAPTFFTSLWRRHLWYAHIILILDTLDRFGPLDPWLFAMAQSMFWADTVFGKQWYITRVHSTSFTCKTNGNRHQQSRIRDETSLCGKVLFFSWVSWVRGLPLWLLEPRWKWKGGAPGRYGMCPPRKEME